MISLIFFFIFNGLMNLEGLRHMGEIETVGKSKLLVPGLGWRKIVIYLFDLHFYVTISEI